MREGIVLYDKDGQEIWACANVDARSDDEVAQLVHMNPELEKQIYRESGQTYALGALPRLFWVKNKMPEVYEKTAVCTMFNDWLIYKMTGVFSSEPSNACTTGIFDLKARDWDDKIAASIGLKTGIFPKISECGTVVAKVGAKGAAETGSGRRARRLVAGRRRRAAGLRGRRRGGRQPGGYLRRQLLAV